MKQKYPYLRSIICGVMMAGLMLPLSLYLFVAEMWVRVHLLFPLLILVVLGLSLTLLVETVRGLWQGVICAVLFVAPIVMACGALIWYYWQDTNAYLRVELKLVAAVSSGLSIILFPLVLQLRQSKSKTSDQPPRLDRQEKQKQEIIEIKQKY
jgi:hypothetical protein